MEIIWFVFIFQKKKKKARKIKGQWAPTVRSGGGGGGGGCEGAETSSREDDRARGIFGICKKIITQLLNREILLVYPLKHS